MSQQPLISNPAIQRMRDGKAALGMVVRLARTPDIALIAKATGHDFVFLDVQQSTMPHDAVAAISVAAIGCGVAPIVRIKSPLDDDAPRFLDAGAMGIVAPNVEDAEQARHIVEMCKFPPKGRRSAPGAYPALEYRSYPFAEIAPLFNENIMVACMIETRKGLENVEDIAKVEGFDMLHIGCNDLLADMGTPGDFSSPEIAAAIRRIIAAARNNGKFAGIGGDRDVARQGRYIREGIRFVTTNSDVAFLMADATRQTEAIRANMDAW